VMGHFRQMLAIISLLVATSLYSAPKPQECTRGCLVKIEGVRSEYSPELHTSVSIFNESSQDLDINVALEGLESGSWMEIAGSVSDGSQAFSKMLRLTPIKAESSLAFVFNPCETSILVNTGDSLRRSDHPCTRSIKKGAPTSLRLRVDVYKRHQGRVIQRVRSKEFRLSAGN